MKDERWNNALYKTEARNDTGLEGYAYVPDGIVVKTSSPLNQHPGSNPEQLLGMSLATCLKSTLEAIEKERGIEHSAQVHVQIAFIGERAKYQFLVNARIRVPKVDLATAEDMVKEAEGRCPVSQLLSGSANYTVETVEEF
ncbi:dihydroneopterin aldolase [Lentilactobacillus curieae]|uniref:Dihydroneopterin aldolase n=1 Tax=Lentilactobacillus curieae TaxID=1138822 RepID=A0A1S6QH00_9LACO|nr:OsmC family protein [Lentilactobacillus curieae]AQW20879.1 dihydroneopterin aldolase [Lentilactobacillus curieae]